MTGRSNAVERRTTGIASEPFLEEGVLEREFVIDEVPASCGRQRPPRHLRHRPLVLMGHPGGLITMYPRLQARARRFAALGFPTAAIELPGSGDRPGIVAVDQARGELRQAIAAGARPGDDVVDRLVLPLVENAVPEWQVLLDSVLTLPEVCRPGGRFRWCHRHRRPVGRDRAARRGSGALRRQLRAPLHHRGSTSGHHSGACAAPVRRSRQRQAGSIGSVRCLRFGGEDAPSKHGRAHRNPVARRRRRRPLLHPPLADLSGFRLHVAAEERASGWR